jgi:hypothetical protein
MAVNDLTTPLIPAPRKRQLLIEFPTAQIIAAALGLFLGLFILWAVVADNPSGVGPMAVVPADLHVAKKGPQIIDVPREPPAADSNGPATTATLSPPPETKPPSGVTVTIVDGKTGLKREVVVAAPDRPGAAPDALRPEQSDNIDTPVQTGTKGADRSKRPAGSVPAR